MYLWITRLISGLAENDSTSNASHALPIEYHSFAARGSKLVRIIEPDRNSLLPWVRCAARRVLRPAGTPACAEMTVSQVADMVH